MSYGIGRVPQDVDGVDEAMATLESLLAAGRRRNIERGIIPDPSEMPVMPEPEPLKAGDQVCPAGTTYGIYTPDGRCSRCGQPGHLNPGAGEILCRRHWDEY